MEEEGVPETWASKTVKWIRSWKVRLEQGLDRFIPHYILLFICIDCIDYRGWGFIYRYICQKRLEEITLGFLKTSTGLGQWIWSWELRTTPVVSEDDWTHQKWSCWVKAAWNQTRDQTMYMIWALLFWVICPSAFFGLVMKFILYIFTSGHISGWLGVALVQHHLSNHILRRDKLYPKGRMKPQQINWNSRLNGLCKIYWI